MKNLKAIKKCWICKELLLNQNDYLFCPFQEPGNHNQSLNSTHFLLFHPENDLWINYGNYWLSWTKGYLTIEEKHHQPPYCKPITGQIEMSLNELKTFDSVEIIQNYLLLK